MSDKTPDTKDDSLVAAVGAILFAADEPLQPKEIAQAVGRAALERVERAIESLRKHYDRHGVGLHVERVAGGVRLATRPEVAGQVRELFRQRNARRLSLAALETLAIIAYRQPVTAPEVQAIRGKDPTAALKGLLDRKLTRCLGRKKVVGNPLMYGTSREFLEHFGLDSLDDLPSIEEFDQFLGTLESAPAGAGLDQIGAVAPEARSAAAVLDDALTSDGAES